MIETDIQHTIWTDLFDVLDHRPGNFDRSP